MLVGGHHLEAPDVPFLEYAFRLADQMRDLSVGSVHLLHGCDGQPLEALARHGHLKHLQDSQQSSLHQNQRSWFRALLCIQSVLLPHHGRLAVFDGARALHDVLQPDGPGQAVQPRDQLRRHSLRLLVVLQQPLRRHGAHEDDEAHKRREELGRAADRHGLDVGRVDPPARARAVPYPQAAEHQPDHDRQRSQRQAPLDRAVPSLPGSPLLDPGSCRFLIRLGPNLQPGCDSLCSTDPRHIFCIVLAVFKGPRVGCCHQSAQLRPEGHGENGHPLDRASVPEFSGHVAPPDRVIRIPAARGDHPALVQAAEAEVLRVGEGVLEVADEQPQERVEVPDHDGVGRALPQRRQRVGGPVRDGHQHEDERHHPVHEGVASGEVLGVLDHVQPASHLDDGAHRRREAPRVGVQAEESPVQLQLRLLDRRDRVGEGAPLVLRPAVEDAHDCEQHHLHLVQGPVQRRVGALLPDWGRNAVLLAIIRSR